MKSSANAVCQVVRLRCEILHATSLTTHGVYALQMKCFYRNRENCIIPAHVSSAMTHNELQATQKFSKRTDSNLVIADDGSSFEHPIIRNPRLGLLNDIEGLSQLLSHGTNDRFKIRVEGSFDAAVKRRNSEENLLNTTDCMEFSKEDYVTGIYTSPMSKERKIKNSDKETIKPKTDLEKSHIYSVAKACNQNRSAFSSAHALTSGLKTQAASTHFTLCERRIVLLDDLEFQLNVPIIPSLLAGIDEPDKKDIPGDILLEIGLLHGVETALESSVFAIKYGARTLFMIPAGNAVTYSIPQLTGKFIPLRHLTDLPHQICYGMKISTEIVGWKRTDISDLFAKSHLSQRYNRKKIANCPGKTVRKEAQCFDLIQTKALQDKGKDGFKGGNLLKTQKKINFFVGNQVCGGGFINEYFQSMKIRKDCPWNKSDVKLVKEYFPINYILSKLI